jgi:hypothetical protein
MKLTPEQLNFLETQKVSLDRIFDAEGLSRSDYQPLMKEMDKIIAIGVTPCAKFSHTMRIRSGSCVQCNTANIAFLERYYDRGYIYIAGSKKEKVVKIGFTSNINNREESLNNGNYGEINDWKILFQVTCKNAGKIEFNTHKKLSKYLTDKSYLKNNKRNQCYEIFSCSYSLAKNTLDENIGDRKNIKKLKENIKIIKEYEFDNVPVNRKRKVISKVISERAKPIIRKTINTKTIVNKKNTLKQKKDKNDVIPEAQQSNSSIPNWLIILIMIILTAIIKTLLARY